MLFIVMTSPKNRKANIIPYNTVILLNMNAVAKGMCLSTFCHKQAYMPSTPMAQEKYNAIDRMSLPEEAASFMNMLALE